MAISIFLAKLFGLYFLIMAILMFVRKKRLLLIVDSLLENPASLFIIAFLTFVSGLLLVLVHNVWVTNWHVLITLIAWITLIAGLIRLFCPELVIKMAGKFKRDAFYYTSAVITLILGLYLSYLGFFS